jgi:hypothetical protein
LELRRRQAEREAAAAAEVPADEPLQDRLRRLALRAFVKARIVMSSVGWARPGPS